MSSLVKKQIFKYDVRALGVRTGVDETAKLLAILSAYRGNCFYFPAGTYMISARLMAYLNSVFEGDEGGSTIIQQLTAYEPGIQPADGVLGADITIRGIDFVGLDTHVVYPNGSIAIHSHIVGADHNDQSDANWAGSRIKVEDCRFFNWGFNAVQLGPGGIARNNRIENVINEGILAGGDDHLIEGNDVYEAGSWGIDVSGCDVRVLNNRLRECGDAAIQVWDGGAIVCTPGVIRSDLARILIRGNQIKGSDTNGILGFANNDGVHILHDISIVDNQIEDVWRVPFGPAPGHRGAVCLQNDAAGTYPLYAAKIRGNIIRNVYGKAVELIDVNGVDVEGNRIEGVTGDGTANEGVGIRAINHTVGGVLASPKNVSIRNNSIVGTAADAIYILGGGAGFQAKSIQIIGNHISSPTGLVNFQELVRLAHVIGFDCLNNYLSGSAHYDGILVDQTSGYGKIQGNKIANCHSPIGNAATGDYIQVRGNDVSEGNAVECTWTGTVLHSRIVGNDGFNPRGSMAFHGGNPAWAATGVAVKNPFGFACFVSFFGGTFTKVYVAGPDGNFRDMGTKLVCVVPADGSVKVDYTVLPSWEWIGIE